MRAFKYPIKTTSRAVLASLIFGIFCREQYFLQKARSAGYRWYFEAISREHRGFIQGLRALKPPAPGETIFFSSVPEYLSDSVVLTAATQVALRRTDIHAELVSTFPTNAAYKLAFAKNQIIIDAKHD